MVKPELGVEVLHSRLKMASDTGAPRLEVNLKTPQEMSRCCFHLQLHQDSQVHKDIVLAVMQLTGYHRAHANPIGRIQPRLIKVDRTLSENFSPQFITKVANKFLKEQLGGTTFFPRYLSGKVSWDTNFHDSEDRLKWLERKDSHDAIRVLRQRMRTLQQ